MAAIYVVLMILSGLALEFLRYEPPENFDVSEKPIKDETYTRMETPKNNISAATEDCVVDFQSTAQEKNFVPVTMALQDLHYFVLDPHNPKESLELLKNINGFAVPGSITALMGSSGADKTALMDVIAGRKTGGKITGIILLNGYEANDLSIRRCTATPSIIFLDEPTSGLDARSAKLIMDGVRKVADSGRTITCTIHQPSAEVFYLFDSLLLLKRGGETVFCGDLGRDCCNLIEYFDGIPGVSSLPLGYNPATWMLECIGAGVNNAAGNQTDFVNYFNGSALNNSATQMKFVVTRFIQMYWRTPSYNLTRMILVVLLALVIGLVFIDADYASYTGLNSGVGMVYMGGQKGWEGVHDHDAELTHDPRALDWTGTRHENQRKDMAKKRKAITWYQVAVLHQVSVVLIIQHVLEC
ncbi:ATP-binding Cassette (ABC) Superfamily [Phytophthora infestans T30-4]|uniref:ATP-binding Cassette (ABC) Superfamily n=1 Tax=Phytophthora infestans (strain T30-4) TaxID=403677 RepID=D0NHT8_PHYIT|nr:ATP-binding Cassette (ABC) Superfamily [Phytophthora infestans T30-4]EEY59013.1 ATP-binding Cassette (ABC) Superfamily [Phytophthora infestans T30-4]|eukprot:XP_002901486.1 ATP-binding Cassette (ABC) Superfamily [Phytophthora infestans T30-4]